MRKVGSRLIWLKGLGLALAILTGSGCASRYQSADQIITSPYQSVLLVSNIPQKKLKKQFIYTVPVIGPDAPVLNLAVLAINLVRLHYSHTSIKELQKMVNGRDVTRAIQNAYTARLKGLKIGHIVQRIDLSSDADVKVADALKKSGASCLLYIDTFYRMTPSMQTFEMIADYAVYDKAGGETPVYHNTVIYQSPVDPSTVGAMTPNEMKVAREKVEAAYRLAVRSAQGSKYDIDQARQVRDRKLKRLDLNMVARKRDDFNWSDHHARRLKAYTVLGATTIARLFHDDLNSKRASAKAVEVPTLTRDGALLGKIKMYPQPTLPNASAFVARLKDGTLIAKSPGGPFLSL